jgi:hypothetical protein
VFGKTFSRGPLPYGPGSLLTLCARLILYFPVSALVTLFGNILQNPLDPRARSDTRLMNLVVTFLSTLGQEAETGGVHRMLGVCSEFEKIAKKVTDKAERDNALRRKRKNHDGSATTGKSNPAPPPPKATVTQPPKPAPTQTQTQTPRPMTSSSTTPHTSHQANGHLSPSMHSDHMTPERAYSPMTATMSHDSSPAMAPAGWNDDFTVNNGGDGMDFSNFADLTGFGSIAAINAATSFPPPSIGIQSPPVGVNGTFQQPMLPADLFSLPMTLDWDWAEMSGGAYPSVENGNFSDMR